MKSADELRRDQLALPPAVPELAKLLGAVPGVLGVGVGLKSVAGRLTDEIAFVVDVVDKLPLSRLAPAHRVPAMFAGVPTDVRECSTWTATIDPNDIDDVVEPTIEGGAPITYDDGDKLRGTLGCFAHLRSDPSVVVLVTDHHTLYLHAADHGPGQLVGQPRVSSTRCCRTHVIARTLDGVRGPIADVAIARLNGNRPFVQMLPGIGKDANGRNEDMIVGVPAEVSVGGIKTAVLCGEPVRKVGRSTGVTEGVVVSINASHPSTHPITLERVDYKQQIIIQPTQGGVDINQRKNFGMAGDSGAVVVNRFNQVVGLLHSAQALDDVMWGELGPMCPGAALDVTAGNYGSAAPIHAVLDLMKIDIFPSKGVNATSTPSGPVAPTGALVPGMAIGRRPMNADDLVRSAVLDDVIAELSTSAFGRAILAMYERHGPEARNLVEHDRRAKIAWHRNHGPAFLAKMLSGLESLDQPIPLEIEGLDLVEALRRITTVFVERGGYEIKRDAERFLPRGFAALDGVRTIRELLARVRAQPGEP